MDSLTQIVIGAAAGEAVLGKKIGNQALVWGAVAGTIPDLDVFSNLFVHPMYGLLYHRGISHSILFSLLVPPLLGFLVWRLYQRQFFARKTTQRAFIIIGSLLYTLVLVASAFLLQASGGHAFAWGWLGVVGLGAWSLGRRFIRNWHTANAPADTSWFDWLMLFFWGFVTHWFIDLCTPYGTQILQPFADTRFAFNNISVVDLLFTVPFLVSVITVSFFRKRRYRRLTLWLGIGWAVLYLGYTFDNKSRVESIIEMNLSAQQIPYEQYTVVPTMLTNILWQSVAESPNYYYYAWYSFLDQSELVQFIQLPKQHELLDPYRGHKFVDILTWFAGDYYTVEPLDEGGVLVHILRFGLMSNTSINGRWRYAMTYRVYEKAGTIEVESWRENREDFAQIFEYFWARMCGHIE